MLVKTKTANELKVISIIGTTIAVAMFALSSIVFVIPVFAQTDGTSGSSSTANDDYDNFQKCLSDAEGSKNYATEQEIRDCFNPIYGGGGSSSSSDSSGTDNTGSSGSSTDNNPSTADNSPGN
jgi:hypothetical protein